MKIKLFIFSDMQFDAAVSQNNIEGGKSAWETNYEAIKAEFDKAGYDMPHIVFWNLNSQPTQPVKGGVRGTTLISGAGPAQMKAFMDGTADAVTPKEDEDGFEHVSHEVAGDEEMQLAEEEEKEAEAESRPVDFMLRVLGNDVFARLRVLD